MLTINVQKTKRKMKENSGKLHLVHVIGPSFGERYFSNEKSNFLLLLLRVQWTYKNQKIGEVAVYKEYFFLWV